MGKLTNQQGNIKADLLSSAQAHKLNNKTVILLMGPTAVGKTALAIRLAQHHQTAVISADSRQCFKELNIGVAKPQDEELRRVRHYFINSHSIEDNVNAALFERLSLSWAEEILADREVAIVVGGTGLYIKAFCSGLDEMPEIALATRMQIESAYQQQGIAWLQKQVKEHDPEFYAFGEILNPRRLMRALEVKLSTGQSILTFQRRKAKTRPFAMRKIGISLPKEQLRRNIEQRVDRMMDAGLLREVESLAAFRKYPALQTVGYAELFSYLDGTCSIEKAVSQIKRNTHSYAKRQMTWFSKDDAITWIGPDDWDKLLKITKA
jgi:tRNA dimethylallyltransferase